VSCRSQSIESKIVSQGLAGNGKPLPFAFCNTCKQWPCAVEVQAPVAGDRRMGMGTLVEDMAEVGDTRRAAQAVVVDLPTADMYRLDVEDPVSS
jgi:hypothetical protein